MTDYLVTISKSSCISNKSILLPISILDYYYHFNKLSKECNEKMKMKYFNKPLTLLGKYKINYNRNIIIFENDLLKINIYGSFIINNNEINYYKSYKVKCIVNEK